MLNNPVDKYDFIKKALNTWADSHNGNLPADNEINECLYVYKLESKAKIDFRDKKRLFKTAKMILDSWEWRKKSFTCCICGKKRFGFGNNPYGALNKSLEPIKWAPDDVCCDDCDIYYVVRGRFYLITHRRDEK